MCCILLGLVLNLPVPNRNVSPHLIAAVHMVLDFIYLAQFGAHSSTSLMHLESSLTHIHNNKDIFVNLKICEHFNMPKIHGLMYYSPSIHLFGTTDNYNTEQMEQLQVDLTKWAFSATSNKDENSQMTTWNIHHENVQVHK
jgi:hypothetical protein